MSALDIVAAMAALAFGGALAIAYFAMRRYLIIFVAAIAMLVAAIYWFGFEPNDERSQLILHQGTGSISSGTKLGVRVGEPWPEADAAIRARFRPRSVFWQTGRYVNDGGTGVTLESRPILVGEAQVSYEDDSWRDGAVTLDLQDGRVTRITWEFCPFCIII